MKTTQRGSRNEIVAPIPTKRSETTSDHTALLFSSTNYHSKSPRLCIRRSTFPLLHNSCHITKRPKRGRFIAASRRSINSVNHSERCLRLPMPYGHFHIPLSVFWCSRNYLLVFLRQKSHGQGRQYGDELAQGMEFASTCEIPAVSAVCPEQAMFSRQSMTGKLIKCFRPRGREARGSSLS